MATLTHSVKNTTVDGRYLLRSPSPAPSLLDVLSSSTVVEVVNVSVTRIIVLNAGVPAAGSEGGSMATSVSASSVTVTAPIPFVSAESLLSSINNDDTLFRNLNLFRR